jgi:hypothetical protein
MHTQSVEKLQSYLTQFEWFLQTRSGRIILSCLLAYLISYVEPTTTQAQQDTIPDPVITLNFQLASGQSYTAGQAEIITESDPTTTTVAIPATDEGGLASFTMTDTYTMTLNGETPFSYASIIVLANQAAIEQASVGYQRQTSPGNPAGGIEQTQAVLSTVSETAETSAHALTISTLLRGSATAIQLIRQENGFHFLQASSWAPYGNLSVADITELTQNITYAGQATSSLFFDLTNQVEEQVSKSLKLELGKALPIEISGKKMLLYLEMVDLEVSPASLTGRLVIPETGVEYTFSGVDANENQIITFGEITFSLVTTQNTLIFLPLINQ